VANRIREASAASRALRETTFETKYVPLQAKAALYSPGALSVLLFGCESWCLTQKGILIPLHNWHNKRICEMCRVTMHQVELYGITRLSCRSALAFGIWINTWGAAPCGGSAAWRAWNRGAFSQRCSASRVGATRRVRIIRFFNEKLETNFGKVLVTLANSNAYGRMIAHS